MDHQKVALCGLSSLSFMVRAHHIVYYNKINVLSITIINYILQRGIETYFCVHMGEWSTKCTMCNRQRRYKIRIVHTQHMDILSNDSFIFLHQPLMQNLTVNLNQCSPKRGHPFMTSTRKSRLAKNSTFYSVQR